jgi:AraC-like DNA-binding protein
MPGSIRSAYSEPEEFQTALRAEGCLSLLIIELGQFRAQLTQISLVDLHISAVEENLSRIAFFEIPADLVVISFPIGSATAPIWSGIKMQSEDFLILRPGEKGYARTEGLTRWATIRVPLKTLVAYGVALTGEEFTIPSISRRWNPPRLASRHLHSLHSAAIRMAANRPQLLVDAMAARGLEQQLLYSTVECLAESRAGNEVGVNPQDQEVMAAFHEVLEGKQGCPTSMTEICAALRVSSPLVRRLCSEHLGMGFNAYDRLRRISLVRRALEHRGSATTCVTAIAYKNGFRDIHRFITSYRAAFGESPYATLQRSRNL